MERAEALAEQFNDIEQQHSADLLGMWIFLATEVMFFGGLLLGYIVYRYSFPTIFEHASHHLDVLAGTADTAILLTSSLTMALGVRALRVGQRQLTVALLLATAALGVAFLVLHGFEYHNEWKEHLVPGPRFNMHGADPQKAQMFFWLYFATTGLHSLHVIIGVLLMLTLTVLVCLKKVDAERFMAVEIGGLYWHFVDIVWVFLFPLYYLAGTATK